MNEDWTVGIKQLSKNKYEVALTTAIDGWCGILIFKVYGLGDRGKKGLASKFYFAEKFNVPLENVYYRS